MGGPETAERGKRAAAEAAAALVSDGARVGLGTGSTVAFLLPALAARNLDVLCTATSPATERRARELGLRVEPLDVVGPLDIAIDGADQVDPARWLVKGGGAAHTREKIVAAAAARFVVIADESKVVDAITAPIPLELLSFGAETTLRALAPAAWRNVPISPDGGRIADYLGAVDDPAALAARLSAAPGVVDHGLFPPALVADVVVGRADGSVERR
jgi:ribose 5-phosphate isomerase A